MKVGIDSYCYHRFFGEVYPEQKAPDKKMTPEDFIQRAGELGVDGVSLESCSLMFRFESHQEQLGRLSKMFSEAVKVAEQYDIKMAVENHIDFNADEMLQLLETVDSPYLGINFDTGNFLRLLDDPVAGMEKLAKYVYTTHIKDLKPQKGVAASEWYFFSCTPVGDGLVDNQKLAQILKNSGYDGVLAVEVDFLHPDYNENEDKAVAQSVSELRRISDALV